jgi:hypothetical protein
MRSLFSSYTEVTSIHYLLKYLSHELKHILERRLLFTIQHYLLLLVLILCRHKTTAAKPTTPQEFKNYFSRTCTNILHFFQNAKLPLREMNAASYGRTAKMQEQRRLLGFHPGSRRRFVFCSMHRPFCR